MEGVHWLLISPAHSFRSQTGYFSWFSPPSPLFLGLAPLLVVILIRRYRNRLYLVTKRFLLLWLYLLYQLSPRIIAQPGDLMYNIKICHTWNSKNFKKTTYHEFVFSWGRDTQNQYQEHDAWWKEALPCHPTYRQPTGTSILCQPPKKCTR